MAASVFRGPRLVSKYWWQLLLALGLPVMAAVAIEAWFAYRTELGQIERTQSVEALALASAVDAGLQRELAYVGRLYDVPWPGHRLARLAEEAEIAISLFPSIVQVRLLQGDRELLFVSQLEPRRIAAEVKAPQGTRVETVSPQFASGRLGPRELPVILVTLPSKRFARERLEMALDLRAISDLLALAAQRDAAAAYVVDEKNRVIAHSDASRAIGREDMSRLAYVVTAREQPAEARAGIASQSVDLAGRAVLATVRSLSFEGWLLVLERPLDEAMAPVRAEARRTFVLMAIALGVALLLASGLARRLARPILSLGRDVERIGRGDLSHRSAIRTDDEIEALGHQVNEMAARLESYTAGLERMVAERTSELQSALRARALFLAAASHDLRQPLYAISLLADTLSEEPMDPGAAEVLRKQREAIDVLRGLFDNLLDLSRFEAGEVRPSLRKVALRELLAPAILDAEVTCRAKGLAFESKVEELWVLTDPDLLRRLVSNLLSNAVRYTAAGTVSLTASRNGDTALLVIADTGIGIAPGDQERIYDEFVQLQAPTSTGTRGVGLGLAIVRRISLLLRMPIHMASALGQGTSFRCEIPLATSVDGEDLVATDAASTDLMA